MKPQLKVNEQGTLPNGNDYIIIERTLHYTEYIAYVGMVNATFKTLEDAKEFVENYE